jgi:hypothetical protein
MAKPAKPAPWSAPHAGAEGEHMRQERSVAEHTTSRWDPQFIRVGIFSSSKAGIARAGNDQEGWTDGATPHVNSEIPKGGLASLAGPLCVRVDADVFLTALVDQQNAPRPFPFETPRVAANATFVPAGPGSPVEVLNIVSPGIYAGPGQPLLWEGQGLIPFTPPGPGTLAVSLTLTDPSSGTVTTISDSIPVVDCDPMPDAAPEASSTASAEPAPVAAPRKERAIPVFDSGEPTHVWLNVPDPVNAPLEYQVLESDENWANDAEAVEVWIDAQGYFYYGIVGNKVRLPERPS